ncbi:MAG: hypothetical protein M5U28_41610 [Sandaracinaceae bacterium]|nr:hypothetical protein [Sandaracinaceae bacterium]
MSADIGGRSTSTYGTPRAAQVTPRRERPAPSSTTRSGRASSSALSNQRWRSSRYSVIEGTPRKRRGSAPSTARRKPQNMPAPSGVAKSSPCGIPTCFQT